ncbi:cytochrome P450 [Nocardioides sp. BP30]|uniref:cytochrome P450 n=1 Tax=Nocardioides sp. BP30 TaxID=3036374 RepID=UPI0024698085|nr:cytochrome P450 [Nocardioides sp. BP30]WGL52435.1 cytochrome P450 [Nocardioides sp. BP30]
MSLLDPVVRPVLDQVKTPVRWGVGHALPRAVFRAAARRGDLQGRLIATAAGRHTFELLDLFDEARARGPLVTTRLTRMTVDHATVREVLSSNDFRTGLPSRAGSAMQRLAAWSATDVISPVEPPSLLVTEPPDHTRYRKLVTRVFSVRAVQRLQERTAEVAAGLLDDLDKQVSESGGAPVDLVEAYCSLLPVTVIAEILGVPLTDRAKVLEFGTAAAPSLDMGLEWRRFREVESGLRAFDAWLTEHLEMLRREPADNLLSELVAAQDDGVGLTPHELKATAGLVLAAGFETTVNLLGNGIALLHDHPEQLASLRADPALWGNAVDEVLRFDPPVLLTGRIADRDTMVAGERVSRDGVVVTVLAGANRDPQVFTDPNTFDVARENARDHVSFSAGRHYCLGAALARMEGEVGLRMFFERYPDVRLLPGANRRPTRILRGYERLPASLRG